MARGKGLAPWKAAMALAAVALSLVMTCEAALARTKLGYDLEDPCSWPLCHALLPIYSALPFQLDGTKGYPKGTGAIDFYPNGTRIVGSEMKQMETSWTRTSKLNTDNLAKTGNITIVGLDSNQTNPAKHQTEGEIVTLDAHLASEEVNEARVQFEAAESGLKSADNLWKAAKAAMEASPSAEKTAAVNSTAEALKSAKATADVSNNDYKTATVYKQQADLMQEQIRAQRQLNDAVEQDDLDGALSFEEQQARDLKQTIETERNNTRALASNLVSKVNKCKCYELAQKFNSSYHTDDPDRTGKYDPDNPLSKHPCEDKKFCDDMDCLSSQEKLDDPKKCKKCKSCIEANKMAYGWPDPISRPWITAAPTSRPTRKPTMAPTMRPGTTKKPTYQPPPKTKVPTTAPTVNPDPICGHVCIAECYDAENVDETSCRDCTECRFKNQVSGDSFMNQIMLQPDAQNSNPCSHPTICPIPCHNIDGLLSAGCNQCAKCLEKNPPISMTRGPCAASDICPTSCRNIKNLQEESCKVCRDCVQPTGADAANHADLGESSIDENEVHLRYAEMVKSFRQRLRLPLEKNIISEKDGAKKLEQLPPSSGSAEPVSEHYSDLLDTMDESEVVALV